MSLLLVAVMVWVAGTAVLVLCTTSVTPWRLLRDLPLTLAVGAIVLHLLFLLSGWFGPVALWQYTAMTLLLTAAAAIRRRRAEMPAPAGSIEAFRPALVVGLLLLLVIQLVLLYPSFGLPLFDWDARILWALKARVLADHGTLRTDFFTDPYRLHIHPRYPLLVPWLTGLFSMARGAYAEGVFRAVILGFALLTSGELYLNLAVRAGLRVAWPVTLSLLLSGVWLSAENFAQVEIAVALFLLLALQRLWRWFDTGKLAELFLSALLLAGATLCKNEGFLLLACCAVALFLVSWRRAGVRQGVVDAIRLIAAYLLVIMPWLLQRAALPAVSDENYLQRLSLSTLLEAIGKLPAIGGAVLQQMLHWPLWHLFWPGMLLLVAWSVIRWRCADERVLLTAIVWPGFLLGVLLVYGISPWRDIGLQIGVTFDRVMLPLLPAGLLLLGMLARSREVGVCDD